MTASALFTPLPLGSVELSHRVVMAPLTRLRSRQPGDVPHALNAEYYGQRASAGGLIITEATDISPQARGYPGAPGIYSAEQIEGWRLVTDAVHAKGGIIFLQIWHTGRVTHSSMQPGGGRPVAPSAVPADGMHMDVNGSSVPFETPRALEEDEIAVIVDDFRQATLNAKSAGFDGVEVHGANGYLIDQFLRDGSNVRTDHMAAVSKTGRASCSRSWKRSCRRGNQGGSGCACRRGAISTTCMTAIRSALFQHAAAELGQRRSRISTSSSRAPTRAAT